MKLHNETDGPPCRHMESYLQEVADGSAKGLRRWYAVAHAARCHRCGTFLQRLKVTLSTLRQTRSTDTDQDALSRLRDKVAAIQNREPLR